MGPGLVVMVADNDAGGISVYAQAGQEHGLSLVWLLLLLAPVLYVVQEMVARLGAVTGAGHARLIYERFGRRWAYFALSDLLVLNVLTIVTEFIGVALALGYFGVSRYVSVPIAAVALILVSGVGSFRRWEQAMYILVALSLIGIPLLAFGAMHGSIGQPAINVGTATQSNGGFLLLIVAIVGTTVAPWQLFFQQSSVVDKRITARWLVFERIDLGVGVVLFTVGAVAVLLTTAVVLSGSGLAFGDAGQVASGLRDRLGWGVGALFAIALLDGSVLGAAAVTLANSYAIGDIFGVKHSLHRRWHDATTFYAVFAGSLALAAIIVLAPHAPLGLVTLGVQALGGVLLPSATIFLLLLCNDRAILGPHTNPRWLNITAYVVVGLLIEMSAMLTLTTMFKSLNLVPLVVGMNLGLGLCLAALGLYSWARPKAPALKASRWEKAAWSMPPFESLPHPARSWARSTGLVVLRIYLLAAAAVVVARVVQAIVGG